MSPIIKRKGEKFTLPGKYLLFILTILCIGLIVLTFNTNLLSAPGKCGWRIPYYSVTERNQ